jgi:hypothetical protein
MLPAEPAQPRQFTLEVDRADLRGVGQVDQPGLDHVLVGVQVQHHLQLVGPDLAVVRVDGDDLVTRKISTLLVNGQAQVLRFRVPYVVQAMFDF